MDVESGSRSPEHRHPKTYKATLLLAYQSLGVVYGDLSISPIYVYQSTLSRMLPHHDMDAEILGVLSLIFWTLTIVALFKYIVVVLEANDDGEGGTFALYSLLCRNAKMGMLSNSPVTPNKLSAYTADSTRKETRSSLLIKSFFEKYQSSRIVLLLTVFLGTGMVVGDGVFTPTMSVLSAVSGIRVKTPELHENITVLITCIILVGLFALQHYGTHRVGFLFAPVLIAWLVCISGVGIYNITKWNPGIIRALSPYYIYNFFKKTGKQGWSSLGGIVLCITGTEAMFADLGHFSKLSIRMAFIGVVYPCLVLTYMGEAAYLSKQPENLGRSFYRAIPEKIFWPIFIIATLATVVASQSIITAAFSIISQCRALGCFPRVKIVHTSNQVHGQIYIPEVNWILMLLCLSITIGFRHTAMIGNAYGLAAITVMFVTTVLMFLIITTVWRRNVVAALLFTISFGSLELLYFAACLSKVHHGGWLPLTLSVITMLAMSIWHYGTTKKQAYEFENRVCLDSLLSFGPSLGLVRVPGIGLVYSNTMTGLPPMFAHLVTNFPAFHRILIFVSLQALTVPRVHLDECFLIRRIGPLEQGLFRCIVRYGYKDGRLSSYDFENQLLMKMAEFLQQELSGLGANGEMSMIGEPTDLVAHAVNGSDDGANVAMQKKMQLRDRVSEDVRELLEQRETGISYMMGQTHIVARESSPFIKKLAIHIYGFLRRNCRPPSVTLGIPSTSLIEVRTVYHV